MRIKALRIDWNPSAKFCAASAHIGWAIAAVAFLSEGYPMLLIWAVAVPLVALKEFWADLTWLEQDSFLGSTMDFATYLIGLGLGTLAREWLWAGAIASMIVLAIIAALDYTDTWPFDAMTGRRARIRDRNE